MWLGQCYTINKWLVVVIVQSLSQVRLCDPMKCSMLGFSVQNYLPEFAKTHIHWVSDAIQQCQALLPFSSCPQLFKASGSFPVSQLFTSGSQSIGVSISPSVLPVNIQDWSPLGWTRWITLQSKGLSGVFYSTTVRKHQFFSAQPSLWSNSHIHTWLLEKPQLWLDVPLSAKWCLGFLYAV